MNALVLENDGREQRAPCVSARKPLCAILPLRAGQSPGGCSAPKYGGLRGDERKAGESPGAFRAPGQVLLPAVRAVAETKVDAFLAGEQSD